MANENGKIVQVMGPVVDVEFPPGSLPELYTALRVTNAAIDERQDGRGFGFEDSSSERQVRHAP